MTSKAAKKAHLLANRGPKVSRAEQRRRDAEELARQKKEYEREKASAKAKAAREKKAAKEHAEREMRRKNGIPEPSRFVRASQPTISMFVKNEKKQTWLDMNTAAEKSNTTAVCDEEAEQVVNSEGPPAKRLKTEDESEDEYGGFPSFSQSELGVVLEEVDGSAQSENIQKDQIGRGLPATSESLNPKSKEPPRSAAKKGSSDELAFQNSDNLNDMAATQLLSEAADAVVRSAKQQKPLTLQTMAGLVPPKPAATAREAVMTRPTHMSPKPVKMARPALQDRSVNMPPPPLPIPIKEKRSISFAPSPPKPQTLPRLLSQPISKPPNPPPSATQAFLEDHLDDFFPSPSQEIRELLDDVDGLPTNTQIARELEPNLPPNAPQEDYFADLICTQGFVLSSQDILEITTPCSPPSKPKKDEQSTSTPTPMPTKPGRQPRRRFFEEKDEDLLHAAIQESKMLTANEGHEKRSSERMNEVKIATGQKEQRGEEKGLSGKTKRALKRTLSNATDYGEDEFHDCEEELLALF
jgi:hypothetical protein